MGVAHLGALAKEGVGLVEEEHQIHVPGARENTLEVLRGLADVFAHHRREIDAKEIE